MVAVAVGRSVAILVVCLPGLIAWPASLTKRNTNTNRYNNHKPKERRIKMWLRGCCTNETNCCECFAKGIYLIAVCIPSRRCLYAYTTRNEHMKNKQWKIAGSQKQFRLENFETLPLIFVYLLVYLVFHLCVCVCVCVWMFRCLSLRVHLYVHVFMCIVGASYTFHLLVASHCRPKISAQPNNVQCKIIARVSYNTSLSFASFPSSARRVHNSSNNNNKREHHLWHKFLNSTIYYDGILSRSLLHNHEHIFFSMPFDYE